VRGFTNPPIGQALACDALKADIATNDIVLFAGVVAEVELSAVAANIL